MDKQLELFVSQISQDDSLFSNVEEAVRQGVILPILAYLGWNTYNVHEVIPEFKAGGGRVDYCLMDGTKKSVFIEVKRVSVDLEGHEEQLLEYSFAEGVELAILTNGLIWWFYLPMGGGNWKQRKFYTIDIKQQNPESASKYFQDFLSKDSITNGDALTQAKKVHESRTKQRLIIQTVPEAWKELISGPDELLIELLAEKVEGMCGHRPEFDYLVEYLYSTFQVKIPKDQIIKAKPKPRRITTDSKIRLTAEGKRKGVTVQLNGKEFSATSVRDLYQQTLEYIVDQGYIKSLKPNLPYATSAKRYLLAEEPYHPKGNSFIASVEYQGYYMEAHKSYDNAISALKRILSLCNLTINEKQ